MNDEEMVAVELRRIIRYEEDPRQYIYLHDLVGRRELPIVIGPNEVYEIERVVTGQSSERPLTHQLCFSAIEALGARIKRVDIVDLRHNTFYAQMVLQNGSGDTTAVVDARPSDAIALALRAQCPIRVARAVLDQAASPLPELPDAPDEPDESDEPDATPEGDDDDDQ